MMTAIPQPFFLSLLVFLFLLHHAHPGSAQSSGSCVPYQGSPATGGLCDYVISIYASNPPHVFLLSQETFQGQDEKAAKETSRAGAFLAPVCRNPLVTYTCLGNFLPCFLGSGNPLVTVQPPCKSICEEVVAGCRQIFEQQQLAAALPNCTELPTSGCLNWNDNTSIPYRQVDCPYPLQYNYPQLKYYTNSTPGYNPKEMCVYPCPAPQWSQGEWDAGITVTLVSAGGSWLLGAFMLVSLCLIPSRRSYPGNLLIYIACCSFGVSSSVIFFSMIVGGPTNLVCTDNYASVGVLPSNAAANSGAGVPCILQGVMITYFALAGSYWWLGLCILIFETIYLNKSRHFIKKFQWIYHILAWGLPLISVICLLAGQAIGSLNGFIPYCIADVGNDWWAWSLFWAPLGLTLIAGSILILISIVRLAQIRFKINGLSSNGQTVEQLVRLLMLIVGYWLVWVYLWGYRIYTHVISSDLTAAINNQAQCNANAELNCPLTTQLNAGPWFILLIDISCDGAIIMACLCFTEVLKFWTQVHKIMHNKPFVEGLYQVRDLVTGKYEGTGATSSEDSSRSAGYLSNLNSSRMSRNTRHTDSVSRQGDNNENDVQEGEKDL